MIWNPWKEIKRLREQLDLYVNMAFEEGRKANYLKFENEYLQGKIDKFSSVEPTNVEAESARIQEKLNSANELIETLLDDCLDADLEISDLIGTLELIAGEAKPTSNATVKRMAAMAQAELDARAEGDPS